MPIARAVRIKEPGGPEVLAIDRIAVDEKPDEAHSSQIGHDELVLDL